ncbi:MAG: FMN-binding protein [Actinobacteria bacterium]|nr:FMN-binding protein [Actinomycetota bacterium]
MGFKRPIMIAGGTVSAVAAVLSYQPAQSSTGVLTSSAPLGSATASNQQGATTTSATASPTTATQTPSAAPSAAPSPTASATKNATKKNKSKQSSTNSGNAANATATNSQPTPSASPSSSQSQAPSQSPSPSQTPTPPPAPSSAPSKTGSKSQTITGPVISTRWGPVQVEIVVENGQIVDATGLQYPSGDRRSSYISQQAIPMLIDLTLQAQSADGIPRIGGATYTSNGWKSSLAAALRNI